MNESEALKVMELVDWIVKDREGWSVTFVGPNPEPTDTSPLHCVGVFGEWYVVGSKGPHWIWNDKNFRGASRLDCLKAAQTAIISAILRAPRV